MTRTQSADMEQKRETQPHICCVHFFFFSRDWKADELTAC